MYKPHVQKFEDSEDQEAADQEIEVCTNFRYIRRTNPAYQQKKQEEKKAKDDKVAAENKDSKKTKVKLPP